MAFLSLDVEKRVEAAAVELLQAFDLLIDAVGYEPLNIRRRGDTSREAQLPRVWVQAIGFAEFGRHTGQYLGALQMGSMNYRADDPEGTVLDNIIGALRGWAQQTDLVTQLNATFVAQASETELTVNYFALEGAPFDMSSGRIQEHVLSSALHVRPSRG